ncbi:ATP-binding protein [Halocatena pleomorpha]|uniref:VWA domain-containing protein n=1 Tax=Halocatena pleomorpha TaxID=1785090 RepID=A0A3P3RJW6_9EURY|nr:ATP-binding protein [Halocatena pleomorpha]RRJ33702.1 VWA domain-containing protein [Halocatena pleomorpha]
MVELRTDKKTLPEGSTLSFTEIVGQAELKEALLATVVSDGLDGLLIRGEKGTGKSTTVRALSDQLPSQSVIAGCPYGCPPDEPKRQCADCRRRTDPETAERSVPLVTLPLGATRERVVGTLSVADALAGEYEFDTGVLARANRGILYIDEVNLLDDHIVDVLLDAAASGVNQVERDGVSVVHPAEFTLIGTMNPEEGELRPQLRDRFALQATVTACEDLDQRVTIINRAIGQADKDGRSTLDTATVQDRVRAARNRLQDVSVPRSIAETIAECCRDSGVEGHRGDIATAHAAMTFAALDDRTTVTESDVQRAVSLALPHRLRSRPFEDAQDIEDVIHGQFDEESEPDDCGDESSSRGEEPSEDGPETDGEADRTTEAESDDREPTAPSSTEARSDEPSDSDQSAEPQGEANGDRTDDGDEAAPIIPGQDRADIGTGNAPDPSVPPVSDEIDSVRGDHVRVPSRINGSGSRVRTQQATPTDRRLDAAASVRAAASRGAQSVASRDLRHSVRQSETAALVVFVVDASASMRPAMAVAKGTVLGLLQDAYQHRDEVAFIAFSGEQADVLLPPTDSVALAARHLKELPTGDRTPLPAGLRTAGELLEHADPDAGLVVAVTDGRANVPRENPVSETRTAATRLAETGAHTLVVDAGDGSGLTKTVAEMTGGERVPLDALSPERVDAAINAIE